MAILSVLFPPDPGRLRLLAALRATLAGLLSFGVVVLLGRVLPVATPDRILGFAVGLFTGASVRDPTRRQQVETMLLVPLAACAAVTLAAFLLDRTLASALLILAIMAAATFAGARGPRGAALGLIALIAAVITLVTHQPPDELPGRVLVIVVSAAIAALIRFVLLPERPAVELARLRHDIRRAIAGVLAGIEAALSAGTWRSADRKRLTRELDRLGEMTLMAEARVAAIASASGLGVHLLEVELATDRLARTALHDLGTPAQQGPLIAATTTLRAALRKNLAPPPPLTAPGALGNTLALLARVLREPPVPEPSPTPPPPSPPASGLRLAVQAVIAGGLAIAIGDWVSPTRWYWAAFAAFVMFQGTRSRGESIAKVTQFMAGTLAGVIAGVLLAAVLSGHPLTTLAMIVLAVFLAFQASTVAYAVMIFWITVILGLLFGMLGYFPPELLLLRLKEAAVGAGCGILVTSLVLARPTRNVTNSATIALLRALGGLVEAAVPALLGGAADPALAARILELVQRSADLRVATAPALQGLAGGRQVMLRRRLALLSGCDFWARELGRTCLRGALLASPVLAQAAREAAARIRADLARLIGDGLPGGDTVSPEPAITAGMLGDDPGQHAVRLLLRIDAALGKLGQLGVVAEAAPTDRGPDLRTTSALR